MTPFAFKQLYAIFYIVCKHVIPDVFVLLTKKNKSAYSKTQFTLLNYGYDLHKFVLYLLSIKQLNVKWYFINMKFKVVYFIIN